ncbi:MAG: hypothetical protein DIU56_017055 [Pseudomonadota bacterium]
MASPVAELLDRELWLARRLRQHGARITDGVTDRDTRRERMRAAILEHGLETVVLGRGQSGKPMTYAQAFEALYGEPLARASRSDEHTRLRSGDPDGAATTLQAGP